jgi:hypothetical protein
MIFHMSTVRTTLVLDQHALSELKRIAADQHRTLSSVVDETLRLGLQRRGNLREPFQPVILPGFDMGSPRVNLADRDQLNETLED